MCHVLPKLCLHMYNVRLEYICVCVAEGFSIEASVPKGTFISVSEFLTLAKS